MVESHFFHHFPNILKVFRFVEYLAGRILKYLQQDDDRACPGYIASVIGCGVVWTGSSPRYVEVVTGMASVGVRIARSR
jgi:hypothetical protein